MTNDELAMTNDKLLARIAELEAQIAYMKHANITCCVCQQTFEISYTCPTCAIRNTGCAVCGSKINLKAMGEVEDPIYMCAECLREADEVEAGK